MDPYTAYQNLLANQGAVPELQQTKSAAEIAWNNAYWEELAVKSAYAQDDAASDLFNTAFYDQLDKLAAADPEFDAILFELDKQAAFNAGYAAS